MVIAMFIIVDTINKDLASTVFLLLGSMALGKWLNEGVERWFDPDKE
jgi:hypothetical protein